MTIPSWPETLPCRFTLDSLSEGAADTLLEYQPDTGPPITRRRATAAGRPLSGELYVTTGQLDTFRTFFDTTISDGALPFWFPNQSGSGDIRVKFSKSGIPRWQRAGAKTWKISISLLILP